ncbi:hypothetical protein [Xanthomonas bromi]|uniref:hypothetical protein n=1 Tax=Xanthomonas bromi TaxID=56449 RepID=UPI001CA494D9|nr:hypothetical protein [Xanthomonas bromi]
MTSFRPVAVHICDHVAGVLPEPVAISRDAIGMANSSAMAGIAKEVIERWKAKCRIPTYCSHGITIADDLPHVAVTNDAVIVSISGHLATAAMRGNV